MPSRLLKRSSRSIASRESSPLPVAIHPDLESDPNPVARDLHANVKATLAPASSGALNSMNAYAEKAHPIFNLHTAPRRSSLRSNNQAHSTIRTVSSFETPSETVASDSLSLQNSGFSSSVNSTASGMSYMSQPQVRNGSDVKLKTERPEDAKPAPTSQNAASLLSPGSVLSPGDAAGESPLSLHVPSYENSPLARDAAFPPGLDTTVGNAGVGKTGRVINKLVSDNEALKRDLKIEKLRAEESRQAAKLIEDKMERMMSDYESRLLDANVTKTLLNRRERKVEQLQTTVDSEKKRASDALGREQTWRDEAEKSKKDATHQVQEANTFAALMEGRYNTISSHWKDQGNEVNRTVAKMTEQIKTLTEERRQDDVKINMLRDLCDQQDVNIRDLRRQKDEIGQLFEDYKLEQERQLRHIKVSAKEREEEQLRTIEESQEVLRQLKWALNVKKNVAGAG